MRFRFDRDAANFVARRPILRMILANYTGVQPSKLAFTYSPFGKPALDRNVYNLRFSSSHSGELAVYAVSRGRVVGGDIERFQQTLLEVPNITKSFFSKDKSHLSRYRHPSERRGVPAFVDPVGSPWKSGWHWNRQPPIAGD